jgi:hypothetical protein
MKNYARHIPNRELVFFVGELPERIRARPADWAVWELKAEMPSRIRVIGEGPDQYCKRNQHRERVCSVCRFDVRERISQ